MSPRPLAAATLVLVALLTTATAALGHADLIASDPADGGTLSATPYTLTLMFDEPLEPNSNVLVRDSGGAEVARGGVSEGNAAVLEVELPVLPDGDYVARWTASTDDGYSERGTVNFTIKGAASASPTPAPDGGAATGGNDLLIALLVAVVAIAGVVGFLLVRGRR